MSNSPASDSYLSVWPAGPSPVEGVAWPKISVVSPNFNGEKTLERTILSIVGQEYPNLEYSVIDGGSTDRSIEILKKHESRLARWEVQPKWGQYRTINHGFSLSTGEIMGWLNSDDTYLPWTLRTVADIFTRFPEIDWIMGLPATVQNGAVYRVRSCRGFPQEWLRFGFFSGMPLGVVQQESCFWRRRLWEKAGPLDETWMKAADFELWTRFAQHAPLVSCDALLGGFNRTGNNLSVVQGTAYQDEVRRAREAVGTRLSTEDQARRNRLARSLEKYGKFSSHRGWSSAAAAVLGLTRHRGATLRRDFQKQEFRLQEESWLA